MWEHIPSLIEAHGGNIKSYLKPSEDILKRSVSIPIKVNQDCTLPGKYECNFRHMMVSLKDGFKISVIVAAYNAEKYRKMY